MALHRAFVGSAFHAMYSNYPRGVSVLMAKSLLCTTKAVKLDPFGRFVLLVLLINNQAYTFVAVYIPPQFTVALWEALMAGVLQVAEGPIILAVDLNAVLSPDINRYGAATRGSSPLEACVRPYNLEEAWRWKNPDTKAYSCYSSTFNTLSRLDMCFVSREMLPRVVGVQYLPCAILNHSPLLLTIDMERPQGYVLWRLSPLWLKDECFKRSTAGT